MIAAFLICVSLLLFQQRDVPANGVGTATLGGVVMTTDEKPQPVRRAIVSVTGPASRGAITDDQGRFSITGLPAGSFSVTALKAAFVTTSYGATRPGGAGTPLVLAEGQAVEISLALSRGGIIGGTIRDQHGAAMAGASVAAINLDIALPGSSISPVVTLTDDRGGFRLFGLLPGDYVIAASARIQGLGNVTVPSEEEVDALLAELARRRDGGASVPGMPGNARPDPPLPTPRAGGIVPSFFPGTVLFSQATTIVVGAGDERSGVDFTVGVVPAGTIVGSVSGDPAAIASVQLSINSDGPYISTLPGSMPVLTKRPDPSGRFEYTGVPPGRYKLTARAGGRVVAGATGTTVGAGGGRGNPAPSGDSVPFLYATTDVEVRGGDEVVAQLPLAPGRTFSGRVVFEGAPPPSIETGPIAVQLTSAGGSWSRSTGVTVMGNSLSTVSPIAVGEDGSFLLAGVPPSRFNVRANLPLAVSAAWWVRSVMADGRDLLDLPPDFSAGIDIKDAVVTFSTRHTALGGRLITSDDHPAPGYFVVAFPTDKSLWLRGGRRLRITRPSSAGEFSFPDLPPGDYFLAALADADGSAWQRPEFLDQVVPAAVKVTIGEGEKARADLRVK